MSDDSNQQIASDDQELAKVLAGVSEEVDQAPIQDEIVTTPIPDPIAPLEDVVEPVDSVPQYIEPAPVEPMTAIDPAPTPAVHTASTPSGELDSIKLEALSELRPLVDKLNVSNEEKFDTYLLLLRSTDDKELIGPAHEAAKSIEDETRRAQALLDIIKEIDFLSQNSAA